MDPKWKRRFLSAGQFGSVPLTIGGYFYLRIAPPQDALKFWPGYASLVAILAFILVRNAKQRVRSVILWISIAVAMVLPACYYVEYQRLTADYGQSRMICGTVYTIKGADYVSRNPGKTREELIEDFAGKTAEIWTENSLTAARVTLGLLYLVAVASLAFALLTGLEEVKHKLFD